VSGIHSRRLGRAEVGVAEIETDYLVIGAGASGMAFTDALITGAEVEVVMVDRRHSPGGHWNDAYPFVRLHQPSATYGVNSRPLGTESIDAEGPNAGFYERATGLEICDYFRRGLEQQLVGSGQVRFFGQCDYVGGHAGEHASCSTRVRSRPTAATSTSTAPPTGCGRRHLGPSSKRANHAAVTDGRLHHLQRRDGRLHRGGPRRRRRQEPGCAHRPPTRPRRFDWISVFEGGFRVIAQMLDEPDLAAWLGTCRLNTTRGLNDHIGDPRVPAGSTR
jgi:hypothetical protein